MQISNAQFEEMVAGHWRQRIDRAALFGSGIPEFRRLHAMNAWVRATIGSPQDPAGADDALRKAFDMTHAWGRGAAGRA